MSCHKLCPTTFRFNFSGLRPDTYMQNLLMNARKGCTVILWRKSSGLARLICWGKSDIARKRLDAKDASDCQYQPLFILSTVMLNQNGSASRRTTQGSQTKASLRGWIQWRRRSKVACREVGQLRKWTEQQQGIWGHSSCSLQVPQNCMKNLWRTHW